MFNNTEELYCEDCDEPLDEDDVLYSPDDEMLCENCFNNRDICSYLDNYIDENDNTEEELEPYE
jgi:hypothetical protein